MLNMNALLVEQAKIVVGLSPVVPSTTTPDYVSLRGYGRCTVIILVNNATTVTGSAITLKQATAVAGTSEKALSFATVYQNIDIAVNDTLTATAVTSDTFTTDATNDKDQIFVIEVREEDLDHKNGFDCLRAGTADATAATVGVIYILWPAKHKRAIPVPSAILD